jgi:hypothetical protein
MSSEVGANALELSPIDRRERRTTIGVDVEHRKNVALRRQNRHDDFGLGRARARDMAGEEGDVVDDLRSPRGCRRSAYATRKRDPKTAVRSLIRPHDQELGTGDAIKTRPVEVVEGRVKFARNRRETRDPIVFAVEQRSEALSDLAVARPLCCFYGKQKPN